MGRRHFSPADGRIICSHPQTREKVKKFRGLLYSSSAYKPNTQDIIDPRTSLLRHFLEDFLDIEVGKYDDMNTKLSAFSNDIKKIKAMETELIEVRNQCRALQEILNINDQRDRLLNLEFVGVPETKEEDLHDLTMKIAQAANHVTKSP
ncbi:unnamed protein product [Euphydryas editha]|uniref:Uncharacterized protein n=1 Tax=Euphydryas editha TaxID=104508 RepID=A0AAU9UGN2_EUPED|nr:unnamed protein product [Euphydryas editha]